MNPIEFPRGTVTFLFTDIEGSTKLLKKLHDGYATLLADHRQILRNVFEKYNGREVDTQGDAFFVSFTRATDALNAVVDIQRVLAGHDWPEGVEVRVRMGLHTGEPWVGEEGYVGMDVHRAARIAHVGHGGQVLLSETTMALVRDELPEGVSLVDLGRHWLKDLPRPERICQLVIEELPSEFPSLSSLEALPPEIPLHLEPTRLPAFLKTEEEELAATIFVGRERELTWLEGFLDGVLAGQGGVVFVIGGPGRGKTALIGEFARRAMESQRDLLVASGNCTAFTGVGDPYLPFRGVMAMLIGDLEDLWAAGDVSREQALRSWEAVLHTVQAIMEYGPNLIDVFVSGKRLMKQARAALEGSSSWLEHLGKFIERSQGLARDLEQIHLFEEYEQVFGEIARKHPLVLTLDDLQWADGASINLLFHLGRRLQGKRILIVGAYRLEEVALGRGEEAHPLEKVLAEFKRLYGDVWIDLDETPESESKEFVEAYLDIEPNRLSEAFRRRLYDHTHGHPLFTVELLRNLQERRDLVQDAQGRWVDGPDLDWSQMPARVEGAIKERVGRLPEALREILRVASVQGETFAAQVLAQVLGSGEGQILRELSQELESRHRLVRERETIRLDGHVLSHYQFSHVLIRDYVYHSLSLRERMLLHGEVAKKLEAIYEDRSGEIATQLANHYLLAGEDEHAIPYLIQAGDQALAMFAYQDAIEAYQTTLRILKKREEYGRAARLLMKIGLAYHIGFDFDNSRKAYEEGFALWQVAGKEFHLEDLPTAPHPFRFMDGEPPTLDPHSIGITHWGRLTYQLFSGLVEYSSDGIIYPDVAKKWEILEGGRKYIFHLRDDVTWSDGIPVTAKDFKYAWKRMIDPADPALGAYMFYDIKGARSYQEGELRDPSELGIQVLDELTLMVELEEPTSYFPHLMANNAMYPVPRHILQQYGKEGWYPEHFVTNGPFLLERLEHGESMVFVRNPTYHGQFNGNVERVEVTFGSPELYYTDQREWLKDYVDDHLDIFEVPFHLYDQVKMRYADELLSFPQGELHYIMFNLKRPPFDDTRVRRAFAMAVDKVSLAGVLLRGYHSPALGGAVPPTIPGHSPGIGLAFNPEGARDLIAQAGYPEGEGFPVVEVLSRSRPYLNEFLKQCWQKQLGVEVAVKELGIEEVSAIVWSIDPTQPHIFHDGYRPDYPDPQNFLRDELYLMMSGLTDLKDDTFSTLLSQSRRILDQSQRIAMIKEADRTLMEEAAIIPLTYSWHHLLVKPWIRNYPAALIHPWKDIIIVPH